MSWEPPGWSAPAAAEPWHPSHRLDSWQQYGLVLAGEGLAVEETQRCARCEMAVRIAGRVTPVGATRCVGAPGGRART